MPSIAALNYHAASKKAAYLRQIGIDARLRPLARDKAETYFHASLAAYVAGWEAYLEQLVREFYSALANPLDAKYHVIHTLAKGRADLAVKKFNTPNHENSRELLVNFTGYDPYPDWIWPSRKMSSLHVKDRLTEILKVRHSFAHSLSIPSHSWTTLPSGQVRITRKSLEMVDSFFTNLIIRTDNGMRRYITSLTRANPW